MATHELCAVKVQCFAIRQACWHTVTPQSFQKCSTAGCCSQFKDEHLSRATARNLAVYAQGKCHVGMSMSDVRALLSHYCML